MNVHARARAEAATDWSWLLHLLGEGALPSSGPTAALPSLAADHQVDTAVGSRLSVDPELAGQLPDELRQTFIGAWRASLHASLLAEDLVAHAGAALDAAAIPWMLLKGAWVEQRLYPDEPGRRPQRDVDLWFRRPDWPRVAATLEDAGYELPPPRWQRFWLRGYFHVHARRRAVPTSVLELHWDLDHPERHRIELDRLWERAVERPVGGRECLGLADEDLFLHLVLHLAHGAHEPRLKWLLDLAHLAADPQLDWEAISRRAARWRLRRAVGQAVAVLRTLLPDGPGTRALDALEGIPQLAVPGYWRMPVPEPAPGGWRRIVSVLETVDGPADRLRFVLFHGLRKASARAALYGL